MSLVEMKVPTIGESVTEVTLSEWLKKDGDYVELDEPICEFESDKATLEFPAEASGIIIHVAAEGDDLEIGALVAKIDTSAAKPASGTDAGTEASVKEEAKPEPAPTSDKEIKHPSPAAAKILRENDMAAEEVKGTGKDGRITKDDAAKAAANKPAPTAQPMSAGVSSDPVATALFSREERREKMSRMRRTIAKRLVSAKNGTAMLTTFNEVDLTNVIALRKKYQEQFVKKYGIKLGFMSLFAKACANALIEMPEVNAFIDGDHLIYHDYADISIAISTPNGLVVPPVHNVESLGFHEIELKIKDLAEKARNNSLSLEEMQGGTFTITNGGVFGSMIAVNGQVEIRPMMYLALSYDHRVIDGSSSVTFLVKVKEALEDPVRLLIGV